MWSLSREELLDLTEFYSRTMNSGSYKSEEAYWRVEECARRCIREGWRREGPVDEEIAWVEN